MTREDVTRELRPSRLSGVAPITQAINVVERQVEPTTEPERRAAARRPA